MKNLWKVIITIVLVVAVGFASYIIGYHNGKGKEEEPQDTAVYISNKNVKDVVDSAYVAVAGTPGVGGSVTPNQNNSPVKDLKVAQKKDGLVVSTPQTNDDVLIGVSGSIVPTDASYELNIMNALVGSLKYVQALVANNVSNCLDAAITYQVRGANSVPENFDVKIMLSAYLESIRLNLMISTADGVVDNCIIVLTYNKDFEVIDFIYANKDVYAIYNPETDMSYYLNSSHTSAGSIREEIDTTLENFEISNSLIDAKTNMKNLLGL